MSARIEAQIKLQSAAKKRRKIAADKRKAKSLKKSRADPKQIGPKQALPKSAAKDKADETLLETVDPELVARAAAYDAPPPQDPDIKNEDADDRAQRKGNAGISVVDVLLEAGQNADESALNVEAVENAEKRVPRKPADKAKEPATSEPRRQKAKAARKAAETESNEEMPLFEDKSKKLAKKARKSSATPVAIVDSDSDEDKNKRRFKPKEVSRIIAEFDIASLRGIAQQMTFARDGIDVNVGATSRLLNMQLILVAAELTMDKQEFKNFKAAMQSSYDDKNDQ